MGNPKWSAKGGGSEVPQLTRIRMGEGKGGKYFVQEEEEEG